MLSAFFRRLKVGEYLFPIESGPEGSALVFDANGDLITGAPDMSGFVGGGGSGVDNRVVRWDGSTAVQSSFVSLDDSGSMAGVLDLTATGTPQLSGITYPTLDGTDGQAVFTDGSGMLEFRSVPNSGSEFCFGVFGDARFTQEVPQVQIDALYGIQTDSHEITTAGTGSVVVNLSGGRQFECQTGVGLNASAEIVSKRAVTYRPGQGVAIMLTSVFAPPVALLTQRAGGRNASTELSFGHDGTNGFGVLYRSEGRLQVQTLTLSTPATGNELSTTTMDSIAIDTSLSSGTAAHNAFQLASNPAFATNGWIPFQNSNTVVFIATTTGPKTGTFSFSSATAAGTQATTQLGVDVVDTWVYQAGWDNPTPFGATPLDPTKGNIYRIQFGYLGYANPEFYIMNPITDKFVLVHTIRYLNANIKPNLDSPFFRIGWLAASLGSTTNISLCGASAAGFIQGERKPTQNPRSQAFTKTGISGIPTNVISIRVRAELNGLINFSQVLPFLASVGVDGTKPAIATIVVNGTLGGEPNWAYSDQTNSIVEFDTAGTTLAGGVFLVSFVLAKTGGETVDLKSLELQLDRGDMLTVLVEATSGTTDATASIVWLED